MSEGEFDFQYASIAPGSPDNEDPLFGKVISDQRPSRKIYDNFVLERVIVPKGFDSK